MRIVCSTLYTVYNAYQITHNMKPLYTKYYILNTPQDTSRNTKYSVLDTGYSPRTRGVATLPTVMVMGVIALAITVGITSVALTESFISQGSAQSSRALFYAESGARDALIKIARKKDYTCSTSDCYTIEFSINGCSNGSDCAKVSVSAGTGTTASPKVITVKGIMKSSTRTLQVSVVLDAGTTDATLQYGTVTSAIWTELTN